MLTILAATPQSEHNFAEPVAIRGETQATLQNCEIGTNYFCKVTLDNGVVLTSDSFESTYEIIHQPTEDEPYIELSVDTDATYQWYKVELAGDEITDKNAQGRYADGDEYAVYIENEGWAGVSYESTSETNFFAVELKADEKVTMMINEDVSEFGIWSEYGNELILYDMSGNTGYTFTAEADDTYFVYAYCSSNTRVRAYLSEAEYNKIDGATTDTLTPEAVGIYVCEVTFKDGTSQMSDWVEITHIHTDEDGDSICDECDEAITEYCDKCGEEAHTSFFAKVICDIKAFFARVIEFFCQLVQL